ncbi:MAG: hypothetical protein GY804_07765 [Alphaproteobacteria bacterium]|nr:hypothetical protein [Alphaproteobacteria bacterium]
MTIADEILEVARELINVVSAENEAIEGKAIDGRNALSQQKLDLSDQYAALHAKAKANPEILVQTDVVKRDEMVSVIRKLRSVTNANASLLKEELDEVDAKNNMDGDEIIAHLMGSIG